ncbi:patatin-like phospholipase family protein, partial [Haloferula sp.]|uniref:patatin-like phospholipase family protein n=1 Tax=Haloferula sp. TaxID=2497595 RepID=UPI003C73FA89
VDFISSVSGGSFTAAYYGLYGEKLFTDFEDEFLRANVQGKLTKSLLNPIHWFGSKGRTQRAIEYYQKSLFHNATFADMQKPDLPMIVINSSDLAEGVRFSFIQEYFSFLGSDLLSFPVARAVAASSAVPVVLNPVVIENYPNPPGGDFRWPANTAAKMRKDSNFRLLYNGLQSYNDKETRKYIHFVDGGITDNTGLRAISDIVAISGGPAALQNKTRIRTPRHVVFLAVNASTEKASELDESNKEPSVLTAMNAATNVQLRRYNTDSIEMARNELYSWAATMSKSGRRVTPHFIEIDFEDVQQAQMRLFLNKIPTSFSLTNEQVDALIKNGRGILRENSDYKKFLNEMR